MGHARRTEQRLASQLLGAHIQPREWRESSVDYGTRRLHDVTLERHAITD